MAKRKPGVHNWYRAVGLHHISRKTVWILSNRAVQQELGAHSIRNRFPQRH